MGVFNFDEMQAFGKVQSVDTATVIVQVEDTAQLSKLQVNHMVRNLKLAKRNGLFPRIL